MKAKTIWALTDGRPGNDNQTLAVAEKLGNYEIKRISFSILARLPNFLLGTSSIGIKTALAAPYPDIIIGAGRKLARVARIIKKRAAGKTKIIQLMWPGYGNKDFDLIFAPKHDCLPAQANLLETDGPPNRINGEMLKINAEKWRPRIPADATTVIAVLLGDISEAEAIKLIGILNNLAGYLVISTSRRTKPKIVSFLKERLNKERYLYEWSAAGENPYFGFIGLADFIIVSEDSISMLAEAVTSGKPVYICQTKVSAKHKSFSQGLLDAGRAKALVDKNLKPYQYQPLKALEFIAKKISERVEN